MLFATWGRSIFYPHPLFGWQAFAMGGSDLFSKKAFGQFFLKVPTKYQPFGFHLSKGADKK